VGSCAFPRAGGRSAGTESFDWVRPSTGGRPPASVSSEKRLFRMESVGLDQDAIEINCTEQLLQGRLLSGNRGVICRLGQRHAKGSGVVADLGKELVVTVLCLHVGASQGFRVTQKFFQILCPPGDPGDLPGLQHLAKLLEVRFV
jgi:hypothetical protein